MLKSRVIPTLLYKDFGLVKGTGFDSLRAVGSAVQAIKVYEMRGVDELVFFDVAATLDGRGPDFDLVDDLADECFMPLTVGGGVTSVDDVYRLLQVGADKVCIGSAALRSPGLVEKAASRFGAQSIVVSIDVRRSADASLQVSTHAGTRPVDGEKLSDVARQMQDAGAGELIVQSVDRDGTMTGYDLDAIRQVAEVTSVPVIASGGAGSYDDFLAALQIDGVDAVAAASLFHFTEQTPAAAKQFLSGHGIPVRR